MADAVDADMIIDYAIEHEPSTGHSHPLSATVHARALTNLVTWPLTGVMPSQLQPLVNPNPGRRGPVAAHPELTAEDRSRLYTHLLKAASSPSTAEDRLLRRQAVYLLAFDNDPQTTEWLAAEHGRALKSARVADDAPSWATARSAAVAMARHGDPEPLSKFIDNLLLDHTQEIANLNYWAYWTGDISEIQLRDDFMHERALPWSGEHLFEHLVSRLHTETGHIELYVHTLSQLLLARPHLLQRRRDLSTVALATVGEALDDSRLPDRTRRELSNIAYAIKLEDR
jgi:hypothetical protein